MKKLAMAFSIAANIANSPILVQDCKNVETSFPTFIACAKSIGMHIVEEIP